MLQPSPPPQGEETTTTTTTTPELADLSFVSTASSTSTATTNSLTAAADVNVFISADQEGNEPPVSPATSPSSASSPWSESFDYYAVKVNALHDAPFYSRIWYGILATSALLDFAAAWTHQMETNRWEKVYSLPRAKRRAQSLLMIPLSTFWATLAANHALFSLIFSCLWFIDAFLTARDSWITAERKLDHQRLLASRSTAQTTGATATMLAAVNRNRANTWLDKPTMAYLISILFQLMLLDVGFYYLIFQIAFEQNIDSIFNWNNKEDLYDQIEEHHTHHQKNKRGEEDEDYFEDYASYAVFFAILRLGMIHLGRLIRKEGQRHVKDVAVILVKDALRHPVSFSRRVRRTLAFARWLKYLAPLIGTANKLLQNFLDLLRKRRQKREADTARRVRRILMKQRTEEEIRIHAASSMQKVYRANKARRLVKALALFQCNKESMAAAKLQKHFRCALECARERIHKKRLELAALEKKRSQMKAEKKILSKRDRIRMYELRLELRKQTDYVINKLLLRPNTRFIVWWKSIFVFAVVFEISGLLLESRMQKHYKSYNNMVEQHLCPTRWSTLPVCNPKLPKPSWHGSISGTIGRWVNMGNTATQSRDGRRGSTNLLSTATRDLPWFCSPTPVRIQGAAISILLFLIRHFDFFLAFVFFVDVFISFFTGEIDPETGLLQPPGFFSRYILPGVLLQCIVNPQMETTAKIIKWSFSEFLHLGPVRVVRWAVALVAPTLLSLHRTGKSILLWIHQQEERHHFLHNYRHHHHRHPRGARRHDLSRSIKLA